MSPSRALAAFALALFACLSAAAGCTGRVDAPFAGLVNPAGRPIGEACAFDDQCETGRCSADPDTEACGECVTIAALGQPCTGAHQGCSTSAVCRDGVCQSLRKIEGDECALGAKGYDYEECDVELYCAPTVRWGMHGVCARRSPIGERCGDGVPCALGLWCDHEDEACMLPIPGACGFGHVCHHGFTCGDDGVCHPGTLAEGAPCGLVDGSFIRNECGPGLICGSAPLPNGGTSSTTCVPLPGKGEPCVRESCGEGLFCLVSRITSTDRVCDTPRGEGEACSNEFYYGIACAEGLECRANTCRPACQ